MAVTSVTLERGKKQFVGAFSEMWTVTGTVDFGSILDGDEDAHDATVPGVALGDIVLGVSLGVDPTDLVIDAAVTAADTVTVVASNTTGGTVNLASTTVKFIVGRPAW